MTAADRPSVTDNARAEAMSRYSFGTYHGQMVQWHDAKKLAVDPFTAGAEWAAGRAETTTATPPGLTVSEDGSVLNWQGVNYVPQRAEMTTATTEDAVQVIHQALQGRWVSVLRVLQEDDDYPAMLRHVVRRLADAGLLATARTRPTRDDLARAIASGYETDHPAPNRHDYRAADAVLALLEGGDDQ